MAPSAGFEPTTKTLEKSRSSAELRGHDEFPGDSEGLSYLGPPATESPAY